MPHPPEPDHSEPDPEELDRSEKKSRYLTAAVIVLAFAIGLAGGMIGAAVAGGLLYGYFMWWKK